MKIRISILISAAAIALAVTGGAFAGTNDPVVQQREVNQDRRIDQGIRSGELTPREAGKLDAQQAKIKRDEARMKADGKLTAKERRKLTREQNRASRNIYRKKHNEKKAVAN